MKNAQYWDARFKALEKEVHKHSRNLYLRLEDEYKRATIRINRDIENWYMHFAENNEMTFLDAKRILDVSEISEFEMTLENYLKVAKSGKFSDEWLRQLDNYNTRVKITRLEYIYVQIQQHIEELFGNELDWVSNLERKIYEDTYYKTAFEIQKRISVGWQFDRLAEKELDKILLTPWTADHLNFSDRIWQDKEKLVDTLKTELIQMVIRLNRSFGT
ncbi:hypothetical protein FACS1894198_6410 [Clostridia bacterium]|nr:hypothetical protein FACS1894198_6410 [Clostridia bacterium]